ncbi:hypothetical protein EV421DRAFT_1774940 [Armillaria borealis]|uniref:Uncharacterized protein n=1 Tax=Armillaria borealis TaxID=47425 RepID=A0AA39JY57_9AGAR|nr:hypothetical protein EV421DRAFT_1774940 [Armillaria borealis]
MHNPFLIVRFVFFSMLIYFSLLILVFAAWNVHATSALGATVSGSAALMLFNSCATLILIALAMAEIAFPQMKFAHVKAELLWTTVMSMFDISASISLIANGPVMTCQLTANWSVCASSTLLVPTTWLKSFLVLAYVFSLFVSAVTHSHEHSSIWSKSVYTVPWFRSTTPDASSDGGSSHTVAAKLGYGNDSWSQYLGDIASTGDRKRKVAEKTHWADKTQIRRGVDDPFVKRSDDSTSANSSRRSSEEISSPTFQSPRTPPAPPRAESKPQSIGSRFIERFRESRVLARPGQSHFSMESFMTSGGAFPRDVDDHDKPIPLPRLSEWMRADAKKGITVHTIPMSP